MLTKEEKEEVDKVFQVVKQFSEETRNLIIAHIKEGLDDTDERRKDCSNTTER